MINFIVFFASRRTYFSATEPPVPRVVLLSCKLRGLHGIGFNHCQTRSLRGGLRKHHHQICSFGDTIIVVCTWNHFKPENIRFGLEKEQMCEGLNSYRGFGFYRTVGGECRPVRSWNHSCLGDLLHIV